MISGVCVRDSGCFVHFIKNILQTNILVSESGVPKIGDFGLSRIIGNENLASTIATNPRGTTRYMAIELVRFHRLLFLNAISVCISWEKIRRPQRSQMSGRLG